MKGFGLRLLGVLALVLATYNPEGRSFTHWVLEGQDGVTPLKAFGGVALVLAGGNVVERTAARGGPGGRA